MYHLKLTFLLRSGDCNLGYLGYNLGSHNREIPESTGQIPESFFSGDSQDLTFLRGSHSGENVSEGSAYTLVGGHKWLQFQNSIVYLWCPLFHYPFHCPVPSLFRQSARAPFNYLLPQSAAI